MRPMRTTTTRCVIERWLNEDVQNDDGWNRRYGLGRFRLVSRGFETRSSILEPVPDGVDNESIEFASDFLSILHRTKYWIIHGPWMLLSNGASWFVVI